MTEEQLYEFLELKKTSEEVEKPENEREARVERIQVVPGDYIIISDEDRERDEILEQSGIPE